VTTRFPRLVAHPDQCLSGFLRLHNSVRQQTACLQGEKYTPIPLIRNCCGIAACLGSKLCHDPIELLRIDAIILSRVKRIEADLTNPPPKPGKGQLPATGYAEITSKKSQHRRRGCDAKEYKYPASLCHDEGPRLGHKRQLL